MALLPSFRLFLLVMAVSAAQSSGAMRPQPDAGIVTSSDGVPIAYEVLGKPGAVSLVFIHGWSCDRSYWAAQLEPFARDFQVVAIDLGGHGDSGLGRKDWTMESFGGDVMTVLETLDLQRVILVGHSMGGNVVVEAARQGPGRVEGLVWVDAYRELDNPWSAAKVQRFLKPFRDDFRKATRTFVRGMFPAGSNESLVERVLSDMSAAPPDVALPALESTLSYGRKVTKVLEELNLPVAAFNAEEPPADIESLNDHGVEVVVMPGVGHFLMIEDPESFNRVLREVVEKFTR